jgi:hypothetical protein
VTVDRTHASSASGDKPAADRYADCPRETLEMSMRGCAGLAFIARMDGDQKAEQIYHDGINEMLDAWECM